MKLYSTTQAAKHLGIGAKTLSRYIADKKVPAPRFLESGQVMHHVWTQEEVEGLRKLLPKITNGRKTRYQKQKPQPGAAVPHKKRGPKKQSKKSTAKG